MNPSFGFIFLEDDSDAVVEVDRNLDSYKGSGRISTLYPILLPYPPPVCTLYRTKTVKDRRTGT